MFLSAAFLWLEGDGIRQEPFDVAGGFKGGLGPPGVRGKMK